jgi:hypothetical protein
MARALLNLACGRFGSRSKPGIDRMINVMGRRSWGLKSPAVVSESRLAELTDLFRKKAGKQDFLGRLLAAGQEHP